MGFSRHWLREQAFVLTTVSGSIDSTSLMEHVQALNQESDGVSGLKELADCRELKDVENLSVSGVTKASLFEGKKPGSRLVILVPKDAPVIYGLARAYQMFAEESREAVKVFTDMNHAMSWLEPDENSLRSILEFVNRVPQLPDC
jgi:hypothetical protein